MSFGKPKGKFLKTRPSYVVETEEEDTGFGGFKAEWTRKAKAERREFMTSFVSRRAAGNAEPEDESSVPKHRRRTRTILGDCDSVANKVAPTQTPRPPRAPPPYAVRGSEFSLGKEAPELQELPKVPSPVRETRVFDTRKGADDDEGPPFAAGNGAGPSSRDETHRPIDDGARDDSGGECPFQDHSGEKEKNFRTVSVPVYSVAGKRVSILDMLVDKTRSMGTSAAHAKRLLRRVACLDADGFIGRDGVGKVLKRFNLECTRDICDALLSRCTSGADGRTAPRQEKVSFATFAKWAMPDETCAATRVGPGTRSGERPNTARCQSSSKFEMVRQSFDRTVSDDDAGTGKPCVSVRPATARPDSQDDDVSPVSSGGFLTVADAEAVLRRKMREKFRGSGHGILRAFQSFDLDGDGFISVAEFANLCKRFCIRVSPNTIAELLTRFAQNDPRGVSFDEFVTQFAEGDAAASTSTEHSKECALSARENAKQKCAEGHSKLTAAFARTRRRVASHGHTRTQRGLLECGIQTPAGRDEPALTLTEARAALGKEFDTGLVRKLKALCDDNCDGLVSKSHALAVSKKHAQSVCDAAEKNAARGWNDGFGRDDSCKRFLPSAVATNPDSAFRGKFGGYGAPHSVKGLETALREKVDQRGVATSERAFRLLFDKTGVGFVDARALAKVLHGFNVPAQTTEVNALIARYSGDGSGKIGVKDFCARLLAPDFPTEATTSKRKIDEKVSRFYRDLCDELGACVALGDGGFVSRKNALSSAAKAAKTANARLSSSAANAAADEASDVSSRNRRDPRFPETETQKNVRCSSFVARCQVAVRFAEEILLKNSSKTEPTVGFEALGGEHYVQIQALSVPAFYGTLTPSSVLKMAREKFLDKVPSKGVSENAKCVGLFDPGHFGFVSVAQFKNGLHQLGLQSVDDTLITQTFKFLARAAPNAGGSKTVSKTVTTSKFAKAFLPPRTAVDRPAASFVVDALVTANAATERDVRDVLSACDVHVDDVSVARLMRLSVGKGSGLDYQKLAAMVSKPEPVPKRKTSPTPKVSHCVTEQWRVRDVSPPKTPPFPPTPPGS